MIPIRGTDIVLFLVALLCPPVAVYIIAGCGCDLLLNDLLTLVGFIPGHVHAIWLVYRRMRAEQRWGPANTKYLGQGHYGPIVDPALIVPPQGRPSYGATAFGRQSV